MNPWLSRGSVCGSYYEENMVMSVVGSVVLEPRLVWTDHTRSVQFHGKGLLWEKRTKGGDEDEEGNRKKSGGICLLFGL